MSTNDFAPDVVYGLGGGGTELALQFLEQDWILDQIIRPRSNRSEDVTVRLFDTATGEMNSKLARRDDIRNRRDKLQESYRGEHANRPGDVTVESVLVSRNLNMTNATVLTGRTEVEAIAAATGIEPDNWWLSDGDVDENLNFAKGVHRERGVAKATLYRAMAGRTDVSAALETTHPSRVAIFVGLGGGSGSGMLFDVIQSVNESNPNNEIVVFGVLPSSAEDSEGVHANAYAALCELEALCLSETNPVEDVVLYHLDPANYEGKEGNQLDATGLEEFDEAFCQSVIAYYAATGEDQFNRTPAFAPFTVAVPQVLSYNVEAIESARDAMERRLDAFAEAFDIESTVIDDVRSFYAATEVPDAATVQADPSFMGVPEESLEALRERLEELAALASEELFEELEYASAARFCDAYDNAKSDVGDDDPLALARQLKNYDNSVRAHHEARDDLDERLGETLVAGIRRVAEQADLLVRRQAIEDNRLKSAVGHIVPLRKGMRRDITASRANLGLDRLEQNVRRCETTVETHRNELESQQSSHTDEVEAAVSRWKTETETVRDELTAHDISEAKTLLDDLRRELHEFSVAVEDATTPSELTQVSNRGVTSVIDDIEAYENRVHVGAFCDFSLVDGNTVREACQKLIEARKTSMAANNSGGFFDKINPFSTGGDQINETRRLRDLHEELDRTGTYSIKPATDEFGVSVAFAVDERLETVRGRVKELEAQIVETVRTVAPAEADAVDDAAFERIESAVHNGSDAGAVVERALTNAIGDTADLEAKVADAEADLADARAELRWYRAADELFESLLGHTYADYVASLDRGYEAERTYRDVGTDFTTGNDFNFRCTLQPQNLMATARKAGLAEAALFDSLAERQTFEGGLDDIVDNIYDRDYHGLRHRRLTGTDANYYGTDVNIGLVAPLRDPLAGTSTELASRVDTGFAVTAPGRPNDSVGLFQVEDERGDPVGPSWDIGVHTFISGVFLDNLRAVSQRGFQREYETLTREKSLALHHAYGLESGTAVRRRNHVDMDRLADREFYIGRDDSAIRAKLIENYIESVAVGPSADSLTTDDPTSGNQTETTQFDDETTQLPDESTQFHDDAPQMGGDN